MTPEKYVKRFRLIAAISWFGFGLLAIVLMILSVIPRIALVPFVAILIGSIPIFNFQTV